MPCVRDLMLAAVNQHGEANFAVLAVRMLCWLLLPT